jgi:hypothetical protein
MQAQRRALLAIHTWCGKPSSKLVTGADFQALVDRFGDDVDDDDRFNSFVSEAAPQRRRRPHRADREPHLASNVQAGSGAPPIDGSAIAGSQTVRAAD